MKCIEGYVDEKNVRFGFTVDNFSATASTEQQAYSPQ